MRRTSRRLPRGQPHQPDTGEAPPPRSSHDPSSPSFPVTPPPKESAGWGAREGGLAACVW
eukprot:CAMPEP_0173436818 /NCGR_PEP_ID=MMETSP1357-20121228/17312_1 /TAXON_ID=77926 /ORGANISM="Hemiselmis rufescens, Strain PCC563" /LENGTH=59 /DNA_ID=CAMNT_0014401961 /DNA_START=40 /DNA_END=216 /DNA_ORIENTATION=-